ncbi:MAG: ABC transporter substrate-binding protein [Rhodobacteraceae bacterium]|jgi:iron complex transport system substrate-binding protein|nr:ABC transporter substrate-binding protein [Paracoccaceae bacterium]
MSGSRRGSDRLAAVLCLALGGAGPAAAETAQPPARVVSMNLCTDQLAMLLAAPGQLVSVSHMATDPLSSAMVEAAQAYRANHGQAEEVYMMRPDLVLAGTYTSVAAVDLLRQLGVPVVQLPPVNALSEVAPQIREVAVALGRAAEGEALAARFEAGLAALSSDLPPVSAALYYPNGYTAGEGTLADDVLGHTGFRNVGAEAGLTGGGTLPLERLVMAEPRLIVTSTPYPGASRSEEILAHPALAALRRTAGVAVTTDADWICGTPALLDAMAAMGAAREALP